MGRQHRGWLASWALGLAFCGLAHGSQLPGNLSPSDVDRVTEIVGVHSAMRMMRSAETYPSFPGVKLGVEVFSLAERGLNNLGDGTGNLPGLNPVPRLYLAKGLFLETELVFSFFPVSDVNPVATLGVMVKHCFYQETETWLSLAFYGAVTDVEGFNSAYDGTGVEVGVVASRDYVRLKPYVGLGALAVRGEVNPSLLAAGNTDNDTWVTTLHAFIGAEIELPLNFTVQADLYNLSFGMSFFVGKKF